MKEEDKTITKPIDFTKSSIYFVTFSVKDNVCCLSQIREKTTKNGTNFSVKLLPSGILLKNRIRRLAKQYSYLTVLECVLMPNHFHLLIEVDYQQNSRLKKADRIFKTILSEFKNSTANVIKTKQFPEFSWNKSSHVFQIPDKVAYQDIVDYIANNPERWHQDVFFVNE
jgi:REP element-mobilizing transposase RayT